MNKASISRVVVKVNLPNLIIEPFHPCVGSERLGKISLRPLLVASMNAGELPGNPKYLGVRFVVAGRIDEPRDGVVLRADARHVDRRRVVQPEMCQKFDVLTNEILFYNHYLLFLSLF